MIILALFSLKHGLLLLLFETEVNVSIIAACIDSQRLADFPNGSVFV
jgi:hypothetical protein